MEITVTRVEESRRRQRPADTELGFGANFTDHMLLVDYDPDHGWHDGRIVPYGPLPLPPSTSMLHYGQQIFEGMKAFHGAGGGVHLFRAMDNMERMRRSAERLCIPDFDAAEMLDAIKQLVLLDRHFIPETDGCSLYIRPTIIATDPFLGVRPSRTYLFFTILSPVGAYFPEGFNPVSIMVSEDRVRAVEGGIGAAKTAGNYAASLRAQVEARKIGCTQVLYLDGRERRFVEEVATMNIFFAIGDEVITSPLSDSILAGVTRDSAIQVLRDWGRRVVERPLAIEEVIAAAREGTLTEVFGTGTAAVIAPVARLWYRGDFYTVGNGATGPLAARLFSHITDIQYGRRADTHGWVERIDL